MKLEKRQVPLLVGLCVLTVGMLGYALFSVFGGSSSRPAVAATGTDTATPGPAAPAQATVGVLPPLPPSFRDDPFRPSLTPHSVADQALPPAPKPYVEPPGVQVAVHETPPPFEAPELPPPPVAWPRQAPEPAVVVRPAVQLVPPPPARPPIQVTGIIEGDNPVAILRWADSSAQRQVVQLKDRVAGRYVVEEISTTGIVLVAGKERWRLFLEN